jgi:hypothetical protein
MKPRTVEVVHRGAESAIIASVAQVLVPKIEERLLLRPNESADLGPRFIEALARRAEKPLPEDVKWIAASAFHFGYAAWWGVAYGLVQERWKLRPWIGGLGLAGFLHLITFARWGGAVLTGAEKKPKERPWRMEIVLASAPLVFGLGTALLYGSGPKRRWFGR